MWVLDPRWLKSSRWGVVLEWDKYQHLCPARGQYKLSPYQGKVSLKKMASDPVLPQPQAISNFRLPTCNKYVPKVFEKPSKLKRNNIYCELESSRRRENTDKASLLRIINVADHLERGGRTEWNLQFMGISQLTTVENYNLTPYNVVLSDHAKPCVKIHLLPSDLYAFLFALNFLFYRNRGSNEYMPHVDIPVWGGRDVLRLKRVVPIGTSKTSSDYLGVYISVLSSASVKKHLKLSGISKILGNKLPAEATEGIFISHNNVPKFAGLIVRTFDAIYLNAEINAQYHATFQVVARKITENPNFTREEYYWCVLDCFYGLDVPLSMRLPSYYVLRIFHKEYLCETYSIYYSDSCTCVDCKRVEEVEVDSDSDSEIETLDYGSENEI